MIDTTYDFTNHRIGDCIGAAYCLQVLREQFDRTIGVVNAGALNVQKWFPLCADEFVQTNPPEWADVESVPIGNIWISTNNVKQASGMAPSMMVAVDDQAYDVALHCLTDAPYNTARNHTPEQFDEIERWLNWHKLSVYRVPQAEAGVPLDDIIAQIGRAKCWIGGDTGFTHAFAAMHPGRPCIAIYGDDWNDIVAFDEERQRMKAVHRWCSDPLSFNLYKRIMQEHRFDERQIKSLLEKLLNLIPATRGA